MAFAALLFGAFASRSTRLTFVALAIGGVYALAQAPRLRRATTAERRLFALMVAGPASLLVVGIPRVGLPELFHLLVVLVVSAAAFGATRVPRTYWLASQGTLVATQGVVLAYLASTGLAGFPLEDLIPDSSSNGITSYLLVLQVNACLVHYALHRRFAWATQLVTLFICVVGYGRGSIMASLALIAGSLLVSAMARTTRSRLPIAVAILALAAGTARYYEEISVFAEANTKFGVAVGDWHRELIFRKYVDELTPATSIVGGRYERTVIARNYNGNPHNSFIRAHHIFGLFYVLSVLALPLVALPRSWSPASMAYLLLGAGVLYFRAFTEPILFPTLLDYFFAGMCFVVSAAPAELAVPARSSATSGEPRGPVPAAAGA